MRDSQEDDNNDEPSQASLRHTQSKSNNNQQQQSASQGNREESQHEEPAKDTEMQDAQNNQVEGESEDEDNTDSEDVKRKKQTNTATANEDIYKWLAQEADEHSERSGSESMLPQARLKRKYIKKPKIQLKQEAEDNPRSPLEGAQEVIARAKQVEECQEKLQGIVKSLLQNARQAAKEVIDEKGAQDDDDCRRYLSQLRWIKSIIMKGLEVAQAESEQTMFKAI